jgi:hypothetical protein
VEYSNPAKATEATRARVSEAYGKLPLSFEANRGQTVERVKFLSRGSGYSLFLAPGEAVMALRQPATSSDNRRHHKQNSASAVLRMKVIGANRSASMEGEDELPGKSNYFMGNDPAKWLTDVATFQRVHYKDVYPGIDLTYHDNQQQLEYDFEIAPGGNPAAAACAAGTTNHCVLTTTNSGNVDTGTCASGYSGSCSFACNNGTWIQVTDTCAPATAAGASISGMVTTVDGQPLGGVAMMLNGTANQTTITDSGGHYEFDGVGANQFYVVTPQLANFTFNPANRSFSLLGDKTDAIFTGLPNPIVTANPLDTSDYFVRQQYLDFLGREPDQQGLDYWSAQLNQCNGDAACLSAQRIEVSAAFFASPEFQQTGSFVYLVYKAGLGRQLSYAEFNAARTQVLAGTSLATSQAAFANAFVQGPEFVQKFQTSLTAESFVDALLAQISAVSQVDLSPQRGQMIATYQTGGSMNQGRALVLQMVTADGSLQQAEYNSSFVLMEYFGYLRRDADPGGYQFWLNALNRVPGSYRGMVCSFITSTEYQRRFSSVITHSNSECGG